MASNANPFQIMKMRPSISTIPGDCFTCCSSDESRYESRVHHMDAMGNKQSLGLDFSSCFFDSGYYAVLNLGRNCAIVLADQIH